MAGLPDPEREQVLIPGRRFRCDFVWRPARLVVEVEGGVFARGKQRHTSGIGYSRDAEKYNLLTLDGWTVVRVTEKHLVAGLAVRWITRAIENAGRQKNAQAIEVPHREKGDRER